MKEFLGSLSQDTVFSILAKTTVRLKKKNQSLEAWKKMIDLMLVQHEFHYTLYSLKKRERKRFVLFLSIYMCLSECIPCMYVRVSSLA